jgi:hypothetical protein
VADLRTSWLKQSFSIAILLVSQTIPSFCQPDSSEAKNRTVLIEKLNSEIIFDGIPEEEAWNKISPISLIMYSPVFGKDASESTDVRITYNEEYMYIGARLFYKDPGMIRSVSFKRDFMGMGCDWFGIILDTYNDKENGVVFFTTPDGLRFDGNIQRDAVTHMPDEKPMNLSYNTFWDVITKQDSKGWTAEIRIPVSSLRFQVINGEVKMGLIIQRWMPAKNEMDIFPSIPPNWGVNSTMKPSQAREIVLNGIKPEKPLYIAPYILTGPESNRELNDKGTSYVKSKKLDFEAGLDIKYGITKSLVMDLTVNTDFAQVESDDQQINLTRFSMYFPEKRMFFLERSSIFDFSIGGNSNLFYSRRIGLSDDEEDPESVRIYGGLRVTGRLNKWDVGFLDMQTAPLENKSFSGMTKTLIPSENFGAMRFRRQVINENSYIGTMITSRLGVDGSYNMAYGLDGIFRIFGDDYLDVRWSQTFEDGVENHSIKDPTLLSANWERRSQKGLGYSLGYAQSGTHFNPGIGFEMIDDYAVVRGSLRYSWISPEISRLYRHSPETRIMYRTYVDDGSLMSFTDYTGWTFQTKNQWQGSLNLVYNIESLRDSLELLVEEVYVPPSEYKYFNFMGNVVTPASKPFYVMMRSEMGQYYDGNRLSIEIQPTWNISKHFELGATYNFDNVKFNSRGVEMTNHIIGLKALYMLDTRLSFNAFIQYNTAYHGIITNLRLRYNPKEGNDLYLVFNEDRNTDLYRELPNLPFYNSRAVMLKYTYTFSL